MPMSSCENEQVLQIFDVNEVGTFEYVQSALMNKSRLDETEFLNCPAYKCPFKVTLCALPSRIRPIMALASWNAEALMLQSSSVDAS